MLVGSHSVVIDKYISAGGFAQIYAVRMGEMELCLKRVLVQSKEGLNQLRGEVEVMQRLATTKNIVRYLDSNAQRLGDGQYEVLVLMELCTKSLLDYMNEHLTSKLTEVEIVKIMGDVALAVYGMHMMKLIHRDIKIENVLIDKQGKFKLCDFGSTCPILRVPQTPQEFQLLHNDLMRQTTPQYRAPEMIDLYRGCPIDEKCDIWALGVFLYKLCYYTTPFESVGELGILHSVYTFPSSPQNFSLELKKLISLMLQENPQYRPNIYQVIMELNKLGTSAIVDDYYGLGEYMYPPQEQRFAKLEPFVASKVPMYQPFREVVVVPNKMSPGRPMTPALGSVPPLPQVPQASSAGTSAPVQGAPKVPDVAYGPSTETHPQSPAQTSQLLQVRAPQTQARRTSRPVSRVNTGTGTGTGMGTGAANVGVNMTNTGASMASVASVANTGVSMVNTGTSMVSVANTGTSMASVAKMGRKVPHAPHAPHATHTQPTAHAAHAAHTQYTQHTQPTQDVQGGMKVERLSRVSTVPKQRNAEKTPHIMVPEEDVLDPLDPFALKKSVSSAKVDADDANSIASVEYSLDDAKDRFPALEVTRVDPLVLQLSGSQSALVDLDLDLDLDDEGNEAAGATSMTEDIK